MKRILFFLTFLLIAPQAYAKSTATVKVNSNVSSSGNNTTNVKSDITVETNGKVTHYSSNKSENIEINSNDDVSEIKVNGKTVSGNSIRNDDSQVSATPSMSSDQKETKSNSKTIFDRFEDFFKKLFFFWK